MSIGGELRIETQYTHFRIIGDATAAHIYGDIGDATTSLTTWADPRITYALTSLAKYPLTLTWVGEGNDDPLPLLVKDQRVRVMMCAPSPGFTYEWVRGIDYEITNNQIIPKERNWSTGMTFRVLYYESN